MAVSVAADHSNIVAAGGASVSTGSFTPINDRVLLVIGQAWENSLSGFSISDSFGKSWTWNERIAFTQYTGWGPDLSIRAWTVIVSGTPGSGTITLTSTGTNPNGWDLVVLELSGVDTTTNDGVADTDTTEASTGTSLAGTLTGTSGNALVGVVTTQWGADNSIALGSPLSEIAGGADNAPQHDMAYGFSASEDATPSASWTNSTDNLGVFFEITTFVASNIPPGLGPSLSEQERGSSITSVMLNF